jgi:hypothetical protein
VREMNSVIEYLKIKNISQKADEESKVEHLDKPAVESDESL